MQNKIFDIHTQFESDTYYTFTEKSAEVTLADTIMSTEINYLAINENKNYGFLNIAFYLRGLKNVTLDFGGAIITFCGRIQPFIIDECENIVIKNITIRYDRPFYSEFDIISNSDGELRVRAKEAFPCRVENGLLIPYSDTWEDRTLNQRAMWLQAFDKQTRAARGLSVVVIGHEDEYNQPHPTAVPNRLIAEEKDGDFILRGNVPANWDESMCVILAHEIRDKSSVAMYCSKDIQIDNFRTLSGAGMGFLAVYTENISLHNANFFHDDLSYGIATNAADGVHFVSCFGKISITDSIFEGMIDDAVNVHSNFYHVESVAEDSFVARFTLHAFNSAFRVFAPGDTIAIYNGSTFAEKERHTIVKMRRIDEGHMEFVTDKPIDKICPEDMIENVSAYPELTIRNCKFDNTNSNLRIQTRRKTVIENCETSLPICLTSDMEVWYEAGNSTDITIQNCKFFGDRGRVLIEPDCRYAPSEPYYHKGIKVLNNVFETNKALYARHADGIAFFGNKTISGKKIALEFENCANITTDLSEAEIRQK